MNAMPAMPMLLATLCASACALFDRCRTTASLACAVAMVGGMFDMAYTHYLPLAVFAALIAGTGIWSATQGWSHAGSRDRMLLTHRAVCAIAMAGLLLTRIDTVIASTTCSARRGFYLTMPSFAVLASTALLAMGVVLTIMLLRKQTGGANSVAAFEPSLMGLSLVLMAA
ncbi:hypothetical protein QZN62_29570 [Burkholderia multivorans]|nr:hypothetical protein [Burkholderia multivorans]